MFATFQKENKIINEAFTAHGTIIKLTNETVVRLQKCVCLLHEPSAKIGKDSGLVRLPFKTK